MRTRTTAASPDWNYTNGGADWNFANCNSTKKVQSPINITTNGSQYRDWADSQFSFLPVYEPVPIDHETKDVNYTHTVFL